MTVNEDTENEDNDVTNLNVGRTSTKLYAIQTPGNNTNQNIKFCYFCIIPRPQTRRMLEENL